MKLTLLCWFYILFWTRKKSNSITEKQYSSSWWVSFSSREKIRGARKARPMPCALFQMSCKYSSGRKREVLRLFTDVRTENQKYFCPAGLIWTVTSSCIPMSWSILCGGMEENAQINTHTTPSSPRRELEGHRLSMLILDLPSHHGPAWWSLDCVWPLLIPPVLILIVTWGLSYVLDVPPASLSRLLWASLPHLSALLPGWGWWDRPWPAGYRIPPSAWILHLLEQLSFH